MVVVVVVVVVVIVVVLPSLILGCGSDWRRFDIRPNRCLALQAVTDAHGVDAHGVGANSAQPHGLG